MTAQPYLHGTNHDTAFTEGLYTLDYFLVISISMVQWINDGPVKMGYHCPKIIGYHSYKPDYV